jgi:inorganic pyrophosphatase
MPRKPLTQLPARAGVETVAEEVRRRVQRDDVHIDVLIEVPRGSRNKYEWDPQRRLMRLDRRIPGAVSYPADYGFIPDTLAVDGDPLDALVLLQEPTYPGVLVVARPVGVCWVSEEGYREAKVICAPIDDPSARNIVDIGDLPKFVLDEICQFFNVYKELDDRPNAHCDGFEGREVARSVITEAQAAAKG